MKKLILGLMLIAGVTFAQTGSITCNTNTPLDSAGVFTAAYEGPLTGYNSIGLTIYSDRASTTNGVVVQFAVKLSTGAYRVIRTYTFTYIAGDITFTKYMPIDAPYMRVLYTNGTIDQTVFSLFVMKHGSGTTPIGDDGKFIVEVDASTMSPSYPLFVSNIPGFRDTLITANIALGDSCTQTLNLGNRRLKTIYMPAAWDAANLTVRVSPDSVTWYNYYSDDVELTIAAGANYAINVNPRVFIGIQYIQLRSGTSAADVDQTAARILKLKIGNY